MNLTKIVHEVAQILDLLHKQFKSTVFTILRGKRNQENNVVANIIKEIEIIKNSQKEISELISTVTEMKTSLESFIADLCKLKNQ